MQLSVEGISIFEHFENVSALQLSTSAVSYVKTLHVYLTAWWNHSVAPIALHPWLNIKGDEKRLQVIYRTAVCYLNIITAQSHLSL